MRLDLVPRQVRRVLPPPGRPHPPSRALPVVTLALALTVLLVLVLLVWERNRLVVEVPAFPALLHPAAAAPGPRTTGTVPHGSTRRTRRDGHVLVHIAGLHAIGSLGAAHWLREHVAELWREFGDADYSAVVGCKFRGTTITKTWTSAERPGPTDKPSQDRVGHLVVGNGGCAYVIDGATTYTPATPRPQITPT